MSEFGQALRAARARAGLTQRQLAQQSGVSLRAIRSIERGLVEQPRPESRRRLAEAAGLDPGEGAFRISLLGPLAVFRAGAEIEPGPLKQRSLLAVLALHPGRVVAREEIIDVLWGDDPPASCVNLVHTYVAGLRRAIGPGLLVTPAGGYRLDAEVDLARFDDLAAQARSSPDECAELAARALDVWRGPIVADLPDTVRRHPSAVTASMRRVAVAMDYAAAALPLAGAADVVARLTPIAHQEPLHEGLHAALIRALAASGQQLTALRMFVEVRGRLRAELGVEPGPEIMAAHREIIGGDRLVASKPPAQLPADTAAFVGRDTHLAQLDAAGSVALIAGTAGVGKTTLAVHWAHRARARFPDGQLFADLRGYAPGPPVRSVVVLTRFLRALGVPAERVPPDEEEAAALYRTRLADQRVLVVLDNAATVEQVRPLLPGGPGSLVLVTSRNRLGGLAVAANVRRVQLDVLEPDAAATLLGSLIGPAEPTSVAELAKTCAYLPLALRVAGSHIASAPGLTVEEYLEDLRESRLDRLTLDEDPASAVRTAFDLSYARLDSDARRLFRLLSLVPGPDFTSATAAVLDGRSTEWARATLSRLAAVGLLHEAVSRRYQFHDLLREYAADQARAEHTAADLNEAGGRLYGHILRTADAATRLLYPYVLRAPLPDSAPGEPVSPPGSAQAAIDWLDAERANLFAAGAQAVERGFGSYAWRITDALRGYLWTRGHSAEGLAAARQGLAVAQAESDIAAEASMENVLGLIHYNLSDYRSALASHTRALDLSRRSGDRTAEAAALHNLGRVHSQTGDHEQEDKCYRGSLTIYRTVGNRHGEATSLNYVGVASLALARVGEAFSYASHALELSRQIGDLDLETRSLHNLGIAWWARGEIRMSVEAFEESISISRTLRNAHMEASALVCLAESHYDAGNIDEALRYSSSAISLGRELGELRHEVGGMEIEALCSYRRGLIAEAAEIFDESLLRARRIEFTYGEISILAGLAPVNRALGRFDVSVDNCEFALNRVIKSSSHLLEVRLLTELAEGKLGQGRNDEAVTIARRAISLASARDQRLGEARALRTLGKVLRRMAFVSEAEGALSAATVLFEELCPAELGYS